MENKETKVENMDNSTNSAKLPVMRSVLVCGYCGSSLDPQSWQPTEETEEMEKMRMDGKFELVEGACCIMKVRLYP